VNVSMLAPVLAGEQAGIPMARQQAIGQPAVMAEGYERLEALTAVATEETMTWAERRGMHSHRLAQTSARALRGRLAKAQAALAALQERWGKKRFTELGALREATQAILQRYQVQGLRSVSYTEEGCEHLVRYDANRPATARVERAVRLTALVDEEVITQTVHRLGWRVYATKAPAAQLPLAQAVLAYRSAYLIERGMGRLKGRPLSLTPMYLERDDPATGLIRLLAIGLRVLTLLEFVVRRRLTAARTMLAGLYAGNPTRAPPRPPPSSYWNALRS
jgi:transposase